MLIGVSIDAVSIPERRSVPDIGFPTATLRLRPGDGGMDHKALNTLIGRVILRDLQRQHQLQLVDLAEQNLGKKA